MSNLFHLIYVSKETERFNKDKVENFLATLRKKNKRLNVTGILLHIQGNFLQVIEGEEDVINELFSQILEDVRHENVTKIVSESIHDRQFPDWTIGFADLPRVELETLEGMNDFFRENTVLANIDTNRAKRIIEGFAKGRWRIN